MATVTIKQNDLKGIFIDTLMLDNVPVDLTSCIIHFHLWKPGVKWRRVAEINVAASGTVKYQPVADDVKEAGKFQQEWEVTFPDTKRLTFPNQGYNTVIILDDLAELD